MTDAEPTGLYLSLLGMPRILLNGADVSRRVRYRKAWVLWALMGCTRGQMHARSVLAEWLWPELAMPAAKANLRQVVGDMRSLLLDAGRDQCLMATVHAIGLSNDPQLTVDVERLRQWARASQEAAAQDGAALPEDGVLEAVPEAVFLQGWDLPLMPNGTDWLRGMRETCDDAFAQLLEFRARRAALQGRMPAAIAAARRLLSLVPAQESHAVLLADLLRRQGSQERAERVLLQSISVIEDQMGVEPVSLGDPPLPERSWSPSSEWRRVCGVFCDVPQDLRTDDQAVQAWHRIWRGLVERAHGMPVDVPGIGWAAVFGLDEACKEPARSACQVARGWLAMDLTEQCRVGVADHRVLVRPGLSPALSVGDVVHCAMRVCWQSAWGEWLATRDVVEASREVGFTPREVCQGLVLFSGPNPSQDQAQPQVMTPLVGRDAELQWLTEQWRQALSCQAAPVLLKAPAGYGKSRLVRALVEQVVQPQGHVLRVVCGWDIRAHPMMPWLRALTGEETGGTLQLMDDRQVLRRQVLQRLRALSADRPLLIWLEDVHWADKATLDHLPVLVREMADCPVLFLMTARPTLDEPVPLKARSLLLERLSPEASRQLLLDHVPATALQNGESDRLIRSAAGIPLILQWLVRSRTAVGPAHAGIQALVQEQLDALGPGRIVLRAASVLGEQFQVSVLQALLPQHAIRTVLARAGNLHLVRSVAPDEWAFGHALVQEVIYDGIDPEQRRHWHAQAASHLETRSQVVADQVARHCQAAHAWTRAAHWWRQAADDAMERDFAADALDCCQRALDALGQVRSQDKTGLTQASLRVQIGHCLHMIEGFGSSAAWQLFGQIDAALSMQQPEDVAQQDLLFAARAGRYMGSSSQGEVGGLKLASELQAMAQTDAQQLMASYATGNSLFWLGRLAESRRALEQALALSDRLSLHHRLLYCTDDPALVCRAFMAWLCWFEGDDEGYRRLALEVEQLIGQPQRPHTVCFALTLLNCARWCQGDWGAMQAGAAHVLGLAGQFRFPLWESVSSLLLICHQAYQGALHNPDMLFAAAQQMQGAYQAGITTSRWMVSDALVARGAFGQARSLLEQACQEAMHHEDQYCVPQMLMLLARCHRHDGDLLHARALEEKAHDSARSMGARGLIRQWGPPGPGSD